LSAAVVVIVLSVESPVLVVLLVVSVSFQAGVVTGAVLDSITASSVAVPGLTASPAAALTGVAQMPLDAKSTTTSAVSPPRTTVTIGHTFRGES
jgi:hypothetical protein